MRYGVALGTAILGSLVFASHSRAEAEWQTHAKWCVNDPGSSGAVYLSNCQRHDQFDSVIACQENSRNAGAVNTIRTAGRATVNAYMDNWKKKACL